MPAHATVREALRARRQHANPVVRYGVRSLSAGYRLGLLVSDAEGRSILRALAGNPRNLHQTMVLTWADRYPEIFAACREHLGDGPERRILSYGCSSGEEVLTLRRYFPAAMVVGAEINRRCLDACRRLPVDHRIAFVRSDLRALRALGPFDAVFCMAVLERTPHAIDARGIDNLRWIYPFKKFDRQVSRLDDLVKPGGLLVLHNTQYRFADATVAGRYAALDAPGQGVDEISKFGRDSRRLERPPAAGSIYVKELG